MSRCDWCPHEAPEGQKFCSDFCEEQADKAMAEIEAEEAAFEEWKTHYYLGFDVECAKDHYYDMLELENEGLLLKPERLARAEGYYKGLLFRFKETE